MLNSYLLTISPAEHCACRGGGEKTITVWTGLYRYSSVWKATKHLCSYHTLIVYVGIANERKLIPQHWVYPDNICPSVGCAWKWRFEPRVKSVRYRKEKAMQEIISEQSTELDIRFVSKYLNKLGFFLLDFIIKNPGTFFFFLD